MVTYVTVDEICEAFKVTKLVARDRIHQISFLFSLLDEPQKSELNDGKALKIPEDSITEFLELSGNRFFGTRGWRKPIIELAEEIRHRR